jgi:hypothetical protein
LQTSNGHYSLLVLLPLLMTGGTSAGGESRLASSILAERPYILLIVADDLGYSDLGCNGGEIDTPYINRLALEGVRFSEFHFNPMCVVTRTPPS